MAKSGRTKDSRTERTIQYSIQASSWAIFHVTGPFPETLQVTWGRIYSEWFPSVNYELAKGSEILNIKDKDLSKPEVSCEISIPVTKST